MTTQNDDTHNWGPGDWRKLAILLLILLNGIAYGLSAIGDGKLFDLAIPFFIGLLLLYGIDIFYSIMLSYKAVVEMKAFILQTTVPVVALGLVAMLALTGSIEGSTTITLFGLSLGYTTYVVGRPIKQDQESPNQKVDHISKGSNTSL